VQALNKCGQELSQSTLSIAPLKVILYSFPLKRNSQRLSEAIVGSLRCQRQLKTERGCQRLMRLSCKKETFRGCKEALRDR
jgi:hypothetical protein